MGQTEEGAKRSISEMNIGVRALFLATLLACGTTLGLEKANESKERLTGWLSEVERPGALRGSTIGKSARLSESNAHSWFKAREQRIEQVTTAYVWHGFMSMEECNHVVRVAEPM